MAHIFLRPRRSVSRFRAGIRLQTLEDRIAPAVTNFGGDPQHTGISAVTSQPVQAIHWQASVNISGGTYYEHYGAPVVTNANTVIYPYRGGVTPPNFHVLGRSGNDGSQLWDVATDWAPTAYNWYPPMQPVLATATNRVYFAGAGGTIYYRTNPDSASGTVTQLAFFGNLTDYFANKSTYDSNVFVDTPLTVDSQGNIYFGFRVNGANPANLVSGLARISATGVGSWISAEAAAGGDTSIDQCARNSAPALSNDESVVYFATRNLSTPAYGRLVGVNATTLAPLYDSGVLKDPRNGGTVNAQILSDSTASPMVGPDGKVFFGVFGNPNNGSRGWMLQFSSNLTTQYTAGGFGWDTTASVVPASMVPQYTGTSTYLIFTKYNNYYQGDGDGSNMIAILDPNSTEIDFHPSSNGLAIMRRVLYKVGPTPDGDLPGVPTAVREWCINHAAVDPATSSVLVNSEDGRFYRWYLPTNTLTEYYQLTFGYGQPYTMTVIGMDGTSYGMEDGILFALGRTPGLSISSPTVAANGTSAVFTVSLDFPRTAPITVNYATADGTAVAGTNYTTMSGMLTFAPGQKSQTITVPIVPGSVTAASANFAINLNNPSNAVVLTGQGVATLLGTAPRVAQVMIGDGSAQRSRVASLTVNFSQIVTLTTSAFQLVRQSDNAPVSLAVGVNNAGPGTVATLTFLGGAVDHGSLADGRYTLRVVSADVGNVAGSLDGNGDGTPGDDFVLASAGSPNPATNIYRLFGDADGDGTVTGTDFLAFRLAFLTSNPAFDADGNGTVDSSDFLQFRLRFLQSV
ncbi:MAG: hypothetical protein K1X57_07920 [Gemmataceae bacterium]|nr:hypothetical protein [Gemmataceae bacterium]